MPRIHCLLPPKEAFAPDGAGAQALKILQSSRFSRYRDSITVYGRPVAAPFPDVAFRPVTPFFPKLFGLNAAMTRAYAREVGKTPPDLIECFNRPEAALWLAKRFPKIPVTVYFGNDPQTMRGTKTPEQRRKLSERLAGVYFISDYLSNRFLEGLPETPDNVGLIRTGIERVCISPPDKSKSIVFVGRIEPIKGVLELAQALADVLPQHADWSATIIGAKWFDGSAPASPYEAAVREAASRCRQIHVTGFLPNTRVREHLRQAAIAVVPSNWDEPFGRTALEALAEGCAVVATKRGGLAEIGHRAAHLRDVTPAEIGRVLQRLVTDDDERHRLQAVAWNDFPFTMEAFAGQWDGYRAHLLQQSRQDLR